MACPLYETDGHPRAQRARDGHAGLWFDKFCDGWRVDGGVWTLKSDDDNPKLAWIESLTKDPIGTPNQIAECALRLMRLTERRGGRAAVFTTEYRFVTGLGRSHPVENGFAWHPTLGAPYLPGSSVKGLVRAWAESDGVEDATIARLLGCPQQAGRLCFLDAAPVGPVRLEADVMTPHYAGWTAVKPPGDWRSPTPIPFLVTAEGARFLFGIVPCRAVEDGDLDAAWAWLREALAWAGAGAKTAVGYGRFRHDEAATTDWTERLRCEDRRREAERERREAMRTPEGRWRLKLKERLEAEILELVRVHLEKDPLPDSGERMALAQAVVSTGLVAYWRRGKTQDPGTGVGKKKLKERVRLLDNALGEGDGPRDE